MAYAPVRSMNTDLHAGMVDATYKHMNPNRGGFVEGLTAREHAQLSDVWYGVHEIDTVVLPDGRVMPMPYFVPNPSVKYEGQ